MKSNRLVTEGRMQESQHVATGDRRHVGGQGIQSTRITECLHAEIHRNSARLLAVRFRRSRDAV